MSEILLAPLHGEKFEMLKVQSIIETATELYMGLTNYPPGNAENETFYSSLPKGKTYDDKFALAILRDHEIIGIVDIIRAYPESNIAEIGLFIIHKNERSKGVGKKTIINIVDFFKKWPHINYLRVEIPDTLSNVFSFWEKVGFIRTEKKQSYKYGLIETMQYEFLLRINYENTNKKN